MYYEGVIKVMEKQLVFIGGPPGVGKSTVAKILLNELQNSAWLDGDGLWRMNPFVVNDITKKMVKNNIKYVLDSFLLARFSTILFSWVLHLDSIVDEINCAIKSDEYFFRHFTLVCDEAILRERIVSDDGRKTDISLALDRLHKARSVNSEIIDTSGKSPQDVAGLLKTKMIS